MSNNFTVPADSVHSPQAAPHQPLTFNAEDQRILKQCNRDAFFQRCLPFSSCLGGLIYFAVKAGYLTPHPSWGAIPKMMGGVFVGYFAGKISFQQICAERLMENPNSAIGALLRARKQQGKGGFQDTLTLDMPGYSLSEEKPGNVYQDDLAPRAYSDLDMDRPYTQGLDDSYRYTFDSPQRPEDFVLPPQSTRPNSYEEMRRKNREDFENKHKSFYSNRPAEEPPRYQPSHPPGPGLTDPYRPTNAYGDIFDK